jgi:hypothetical protein
LYADSSLEQGSWKNGSIFDRGTTTPSSARRDGRCQLQKPVASTVMASSRQRCTRLKILAEIGRAIR